MVAAAMAAEVAENEGGSLRERGIPIGQRLSHITSDYSLHYIVNTSPNVRIPIRE